MADPAAGRGLIPRLLSDSPRESATDIEPRIQIIEPRIQIETVRSKMDDAVADYGAETVVNAVVPAKDVGPAAQASTVVQAASSVESVSELLQTVTTSALNGLGTAIGLTPGETVISSGICTNYLLAPITGPLENAATFLEIAGAVIGLATGTHPLVLACAKLLAHHEAEHLVAAGITNLISGPQAPEGALGAHASAVGGVPQPVVDEPVMLTPIYARPVTPDMEIHPVTEFRERPRAESLVRIERRADAAATPRQDSHADMPWVCLGLNPGRPKPVEAPMAAIGDGDVVDQVRKAAVLPASDGEFVARLGRVLLRSSVREVDMATAKAIGQLQTGIHLVLRIDGVGLGTFSTGSGSNPAYQHPGCLTGRPIFLSTSSKASGKLSLDPPRKAA